MIRGICFDMDGVLFDTERLGSRMMSAAASLQGETLLEEHWNALIGKTMHQTMDALHLWFPRLDTERFIRDWKAVTLSHVRRHGMPLKEGAAELLAWAQAAGLRLALCTSNDPDVVDAYLRLCGWENLFQPVVTRLMIASPKPAPDCYLKAAELMGLSPAECAGVEDSPAGVRAVRAAGMLSVMVPDVIPFSGDLAPFVDRVFPGLKDLQAFLSGGIPVPDAPAPRSERPV